MSKDEFAEIANQDSPSAVKFPSTWPAIFAWMTIRFGLGIVVAIVFGFAVRVVYADMQNMNEKLLLAYVDATVASSKNAEAIRDLTEEIQRQNEIDKAQNEIIIKQTEAIEKLRDNR